MQWLALGGAVVLLAILTGRGGELAAYLRPSGNADVGVGGGGSGLTDAAIASNAYTLPLASYSMPGSAAVATPTYAQAPRQPTTSGGSLEEGASSSRGSGGTTGGGSLEGGTVSTRTPIPTQPAAPQHYF